MPVLSDKVIHRLTLYHCILKYTLINQDRVSSFEIANLLGLDNSQVRKDIALCGVLGHKKQGYNSTELKLAIEQKLGFKETKEVFIIGAGHLGTALANYTDFKDYGIDILCLLDNNPNKIGKEINGKKVLPLEDLQSLISRVNTKNIILAVPAKQAQAVTDYAVQCGAQFIWNFTPTVLKIPKNVMVYYENIISSFMQMYKEPINHKHTIFSRLKIMKGHK
ncbi:MAG: redox-sensing transcriptional repressor Rex [Alphaproteobacteria bacterium]|nr:redox-sensing transcriptional repressor Rex [Alphaproteobacteria bacterium]